MPTLMQTQRAAGPFIVSAGRRVKPVKPVVIRKEYRRAPVFFFRDSPVSAVSHACHAVSLRFHTGFIGFTRLVVKCSMACREAACLPGGGLPGAMVHRGRSQCLARCALLRGLGLGAATLLTSPRHIGASRHRAPPHGFHGQGLHAVVPGLTVNLWPRHWQGCHCGGEVALAVATSWEAICKLSLSVGTESSRPSFCYTPSYDRGLEVTGPLLRSGCP